MSDKKLKKEVSKFYEGKDGIGNQTNLYDAIEFIEGGYDTIAALLHNLLNRVGCKPEEILILTPKWEDANNLYATLPSDLQPKCKVTRDVVDKRLIITTYHSSKGLENRICILVNIDDVRELKLIYVGMTRASQRLYIHATDFSYSAIANQMRQDSFTEAADEDDVDSLPFSIKTLSDIKLTPDDDLPF